MIFRFYFRDLCRSKFVTCSFCLQATYHLVNHAVQVKNLNLPK